MIQSLPGKKDEAIGLYQAIMPVFKQLKGSKDLLVLTDSKTSKGVAIALWENEADLKAGESSESYQQQLIKFRDVVEGTPIR